MKIQTIVKDEKDRVWDSIREDAPRSLCRVLEHMKNDHNYDASVVGKEAMFLLDNKNDYQSAIWFLESCGYTVIVKNLGE